MQPSIKVKKAWGWILQKYGATIWKYYADNDILTLKTFVNHAMYCNQAIGYFGDGLHFQYGIAENIIKILSEDACNMLLHPNYLWPKVCVLLLCIFSIKEDQ